jgi:hypothetical protein
MSIIELSGSPRESLNESSGSSAERRFLVPMNQRITFAQSLVGTAYPNFPQARIVAVDLQPWMGDDAKPDGVITDPETATADYGDQLCLVTAKYGPDFTKKDWPSDFAKPSPIRLGTELRFQIRGTAKFLPIPTSGTKWEDDGGGSGSGGSGGGDIPVPEDANSAILIPSRALQLQWDFVDDPPIAALEDLVGRLNSDSFLGSEPETLLFEGYDVSETFRASPINPHTNRVTVNISQRRIDAGGSIVGWNHDYREEPAGWIKLLLSDGEPRYKLTTFAGMFA